jgi:hypothetical protein
MLLILLRMMMRVARNFLRAGTIFHMSLYRQISHVPSRVSSEITPHLKGSHERDQIAPKLAETGRAPTKHLKQFSR